MTAEVSGRRQRARVQVRLSLSERDALFPFLASLGAEQRGSAVLALATTAFMAQRGATTEPANDGAQGPAPSLVAGPSPRREPKQVPKAVSAAMSDLPVPASKFFDAGSKFDLGLYA